MVESYYDTYFLDSRVALKIALCKNRVATSNPNVDGLQICYYDGDKLKNAPKNCINIKSDNIVEYFSRTKYRIAKKVNLENSIYINEEDKELFQNVFSKLVKSSLLKRANYHEEISSKIQALKPDFSDKVLRVFIPACRETTVMKHVSKNIEKAFKKLNFEVFKENIEDDMLSCWLLEDMKNISEFNPHIIVNINHLNNTFLNEYIFNFVWFQDAMPVLINDKKIKLRKRDYIFSYGILFTKLLLKNNVPKNKIFKQDVIFIDTTEFYLNDKIKREKKVIFVGSHYSKSRYIKYITNDIDNELKNYINNGNILSNKLIIKIFKKYGKDVSCDMSYINDIQQSYNRNQIVSWLVMNNNIKSEIYGYGWNDSEDNLILNKFKGEVKKTKLNTLYNSAKYILSVSGQLINTQRLGEIVHSGAIPVVYDSRDITDEKETWDDECLYFKTKEELNFILENNIEPKNYRSKKMLKHFTYKKFTDKIEKIIKNELNK